MFSFKKKNKDLKILATQDGTIVSIDNVPDDVFSQKCLVTALQLYLKVMRYILL